MSDIVSTEEKPDKFAAFKDIAGGLGSSLTAGIGGTLGAGFSGALSDSLFGNSAAKEARAVADELYPNTTAMERLSNGGGGAAGAGGSESLSKRALQASIKQADEQVKVKREEQQNTAKVADETNKAMLAGKMVDNMSMRGLGFSGNPAAHLLGGEVDLYGYLTDKFGKDPNGSTRPSGGPDSHTQQIKQFWKRYKMPKDPKAISEGFKKGVPAMTDDVLKWFD